MRRFVMSAVTQHLLGHISLSSAAAVSHELTASEER